MMPQFLLTLFSLGFLVVMETPCLSLDTTLETNDRSYHSSQETACKEQEKNLNIIEATTTPLKEENFGTYEFFEKKLKEIMSLDQQQTSTFIATLKEALKDEALFKSSTKEKRFPQPHDLWSYQLKKLRASKLSLKRKEALSKKQKVLLPPLTLYHYLSLCVALNPDYQITTGYEQGLPWIVDEEWPKVTYVLKIIGLPADAQYAPALRQEIQRFCHLFLPPLEMSQDTYNEMTRLYKKLPQDYSIELALAQEKGFSKIPSDLRKFEYTLNTHEATILFTISVILSYILYYSVP